VYHRLPRFAAAIAIAGALLASATSAEAHVAGASYGDFALVDATSVEGILVFARADADLLAPGGEPDLRALAAEGIDVRADGAACPGTLERAGEVAGDGFEVRVRFPCPHPPGLLDVSLPLLDTLPAGHLHQIRVTALGRRRPAIEQPGRPAEDRNGAPGRSRARRDERGRGGPAPRGDRLVVDRAP
jgi:hypothetical protein